MVTTRSTGRPSPAPPPAAKSRSSKRKASTTAATGGSDGPNTRQKRTKGQTPKPATKAGGAKAKAKTTPSSQLHSESTLASTSTSSAATLEKGTIYFFFRPKVSTPHAESLSDVQRSYIVLRPQGKRNVNRILIVPKKKLPQRGRERFLTFVESPGVGVDEVEEYLKESSYVTKTRGERKNSPAKPIAEGVYAIIKSEKEHSSHLAYILTFPREPSQLQGEFGLRERGSLIVSVKNPAKPSNARVGIQKPAEFPEELLRGFERHKWAPLRPEHLEYKNAEVLFIAEKGVPRREEGQKESVEELEELEDGDVRRIEYLGGGDAVFADLELDKGKFEGILTTW